jgi:hypothetical protein
MARNTAKDTTTIMISRTVAMQLRAWCQSSGMSICKSAEQAILDWVNGGGELAVRTFRYSNRTAAAEAAPKYIKGDTK